MSVDAHIPQNLINEHEHKEFIEGLKEELLRLSKQVEAEREKW